MKPFHLAALLLLLLVPRPHAPEAPTQPAAPLGTITGASTMSAAQIDAVLASYGSPAAGTGATWVAEGNARGINAAYALAFFIHESSAATASGWAGWKPDGTTTHNPGNIICAGYPTCYGRFRDYGSWQAGIADWFRLIATEYVQGRGLTTVEGIVPVYAPAFENDVDVYVAAVNGMVAGWEDTKAPAGAFVSSPLARDGFGVYTPDCIERNVIGSLEQSPGLQRIVIAPGAVWSFNQAWAVDTGTLVPCYGVLGGSVCDLAARVSEVAHGLGLRTQMTYHGFTLAGVGAADSTAIWGTPGVSGGQDLTIENETSDTIIIEAQITDVDVRYTGWRE